MLISGLLRLRLIARGSTELDSFSSIPVDGMCCGRRFPGDVFPVDSLQIKFGSVFTTGKVWLRGLGVLTPRPAWSVTVKGFSDGKITVDSPVVVVKEPKSTDVVSCGNECVNSLSLNAGSNAMLSFFCIGRWCCCCCCGEAGEGVVVATGEAGESMLLGVWEEDTFPVPSTALLLSTEPFLDTDPVAQLFFRLNFSSQLAVRSFWWVSAFPTVFAKNTAFSLIIASLNSPP